MRIADSTAVLGAEYSVNESYKTSVTRESARVVNDETVAASARVEGVEVNISEAGADLLAQDSGRTTLSAGYSAESVESVRYSGLFISSKDDLELRMLQRLLESITGRRIPLRAVMPEFKSDRLQAADVNGKLAKLQTAIPSGNRPATNRMLNTTTIESSYSREDRMQFSAEAQIYTADGMKIDIAINLSMSRSFATSNSISWSTEVQYCDPLVLNFNGRGAELSGGTMSFDIDNDGTSDQISLLAEGNGFLALDLNNDGVIGDGSELFGVKSGNGFADLAVHDADNNGWIDENDEIYDKLRVMFTDADGNQRLVALGELGVGAIYLGSAQSDFELRDEQNEAQGKITHTGFFLYESGNAGLVQNVNFRMYDIPTQEPLLYDTAV